MSKNSTKHFCLETKNNNKRRSIETSNNTSTDAASIDAAKKTKRRRENPPFLSGMILAVSTLQEESSNSDLELSYCKVAEMLRDCGAKVSGQVHKRVQCVLCTPAAMTKATQRVRKAKKKKIPLVDMDWLHQCIEKEKKLPLDGFLLPYPVEEKPITTTFKRQEENKRVAEDDNPIVDHNDIPDDAGWTSPVDVGCCCVCHENGTEADCEWCQDCK